MKNHETPPTRPYEEGKPKVEPKALPPHLRYELLGMDETLQSLLW